MGRQQRGEQGELRRHQRLQPQEAGDAAGRHSGSLEVPGDDFVGGTLKSETPVKIHPKPNGLEPHFPIFPYSQSYLCFFLECSDTAIGFPRCLG